MLSNQVKGHTCSSTVLLWVSTETSATLSNLTCLAGMVTCLGQNTRIVCSSRMQRSHVGQDGSRTPLAEWKGLLYNLSTTHPVCQALKPKLWPSIEGLLEARDQPLVYTTLQHIKGYNPCLYHFLAPQLGCILPGYYKALLTAMLTVARRCYARSTVSTISGELTPRVASQPVRYVAAPSDRPPEVWGDEEDYIRTGIWTGTVRSGQAFRKLGTYLADFKKPPPNPCRKFGECTQRLLPGCLFGWCVGCGTCLGFTLMDDRESPKTVFELVYSFFEQAPSLLLYDSGCRLLPYCLAREGYHFQATSFMVDELHWNNHVECSTDFNSKHYPWIKNSSLAEQKNSVIRSLESNASYMSQVVFLLYVRFFVHRLNRIQALRHGGGLFWASKTR